MAGPLDGFDPNAQPELTGPLKGFDPTPSPSPTPSIPLFSLTGKDKAGEWLNTAIDAGTAGLADTLSGKVNQWTGGLTGNQTADQLRAQTEAGRQDIGPIGSATADLAGYAFGPGKLAVGEKLAGLMGGKLAARMTGSAAEGALASGVGTAGHGDTDVSDIAKATMLGGLTGAATGALPGSAPKVSTPTTDELKVLAQGKFTPLENAYLNAKDVGKEFNATANSISPGSRQAISPSLQGKIDDISQEISTNQNLSADDLAKFQRSLMKSARGPQDQEIAGRYVTSLDTALGPHAPAVADANAATNIYKTSRDIDRWLADPESAPKAVASALAKRPGLYQSQPGLFDLLKSVGQSQPGLWSKFTGKVGSGLAGAAIQGGAEYLGGQNPVVGALAGGLEGLVLGHAANQYRVGPIKAKLQAAKYLNATGAEFQPRHPVMGALGDFARTAGYAAGSSGAF